MKINNITQTAKQVATKVANTAQNIGKRTIEFSKLAGERADEFIKNNKVLNKISKEHVVGGGVIAIAAVVLTKCLKSFKKNVDDELKK